MGVVVSQRPHISWEEFIQYIANINDLHKITRFADSISHLELTPVIRSKIKFRSTRLDAEAAIQSLRHVNTPRNHLYN